MTLGGDVLAAEVQGFCVEGQCADVEPHLSDPVAVEAGAHEAEFEWEWGSADAAFTVCRGLTFEDCDEVESVDASLDDGFELELEPGVYRLSVFLSWDDGNDASYHFAVEAA